MNIGKELMSEFIDMLEGNKKERVIVRSVKIRPEWEEAIKEMTDATKAAHKKLDKMQKDAEALRKKHDKLKRRAWGQIHLGLDHFGDMQLNKETNEIEILGDEDDEEDED